MKKDEHKLKNDNFIEAWYNAINGIVYTATTQRNFRIQLILAVIVLALSLFYGLGTTEFLCLVFALFFVIFAEMVNTAIETVVDLYVDVYHPKAKIAKDVAAGGVVITAINAIIVAYFLFFDKISDMGIAFIQNVANSPIHLAFATIVITMIATLAIIAYSKTNKHKVFNEKFVPSGHATIAFAANTIIWITTQNPVILILSLVMAILIAESRIQAKEHKLSEVIFSACMGILIVLIIYSISINLLKF